MKKLTYLFVLLMLSFPVCASASNYIRGDVDRDGNVGIGDVAGLIDYLLSGVWDDEPADVHEYVDLGLPSGTLWATMNIGAESPEDFGDYFAWGETAPKSNYHWDTYTLCDNGNDRVMLKYCTYSNGQGAPTGIVDNIFELEPEDDAAYVNWGPLWRMPSYSQMEELRTKCSWQWTQMNNVNGCLLTGPNGNSLFLPAAGVRMWTFLHLDGSACLYWMRTIDYQMPTQAYDLLIQSDDCKRSSYVRHAGLSVRAVRVQ